MKHLIGGVLILLLAFTAGQADDKPKDKAPTPKAQYDALKKEHGAVVKAYIEASNKAETPEARQKLTKDEAPKLEKVLAKFMELAEKHPKDAVAFDALLVVAGDHLASRAGGASKKKALEVLARDHVASDKIGPLCRELASNYDSQSDKLLRSILEKNASKSIQAEACLALTESLRQRAAIAKRIASDKELAKRAEEFFGKETAAELAKLDPAKLEEEGESLSKQFAEKYVGEMEPERLARVCQQLAFSSDKSSETLLRKLASHDKKEVKGMAVLSLAQVLKQQADDKHEKDAKAADQLRKESEKLFEEAAEKYGDMKVNFRDTVGETAKRELYEIRHLSIGKEAPDVEGEDQDGKKFKLSDYKGKVVLLDFWGQF